MALSMFKPRWAPVSERARFTAMADSLTQHQFNLIARRCPNFYLHAFMQREGFLTFGPNELGECRALARALDRRADELQSLLDAKAFVSEP